MKKRFYFPFVIKAYIFFLTVLLVSLLGSSYYIHKESKNTVHAMINQQFDQAISMAQNHFDLLEQMNKTLINNLAEDHELIRYMRLQDKERLRNLIADKRYDIQCDQIILLDNKANLITQSGSVPFEGNTLQNQDIVQKTLNQHKQFSNIIRQYDVFVLYASSPVMIDNKQHGMLLMGFNMNHEMMQNIKKETVMEFSIIGDRTVAATSFQIDKNLLTTLPMPYMDYRWLLKYPNRYYEARVGDKEYFLTARPLENVDRISTASLMMAYPTADVQRHEDKLIQSIIVSGLIAIVFFMIIVFIFAKKIANIFKMMISQTQKIKQGDYEQRLSFNTHDEFELLSQNFNSMTHSLQTQRKTIKEYTDSLESKVEKRTQELNAQKQSLEQILNLHPSMILTIEGENILYANQLFLDFFGISSIESIQTKDKLCELFRANQDYTAKKESVKSFSQSLFSKNNQIISLYSHKSEEKIFEVDFITLDSIKNKEIAVFKDVTRLSSENERLEELAIRDVLTGQYNRVKFNEELEKALYNVSRYDAVYSIVICDIDNFKKVNDTYGHVTGDYALVTMSEIFSKRIRISDTFARWGGEEFVILLHSANAAEAEKFANTLRQALYEFKFKDFGKLTCSFGLTQILKDDTMQTLVDRADQGLYYSKEHGKNRVTVV